MSNDFLRQGFCFTGKAKLKNVDVTRAELEQFVHRNGGYVTPRVTSSTDILVASRTDTTKAQDAISQGKRVITYDEFFTMANVEFPHELAAEPMDAARKAREREQQEAKERVEAKREERRRQKEAHEQAMREAEDAIEGWGMF